MHRPSSHPCDYCSVTEPGRRSTSFWALADRTYGGRDHVLHEEARVIVFPTLRFIHACMHVVMDHAVEEARETRASRSFHASLRVSRAP